MLSLFNAILNCKTAQRGRECRCGAAFGGQACCNVLLAQLAAWLPGAVTLVAQSPSLKGDAQQHVPLQPVITFPSQHHVFTSVLVTIAMVIFVLMSV